MGKHIYYIPCLIKLNLQTKRMQCLSVVLTCVLLIIIISILVVIWYFEGPDDGGYEMLKLPMETPIVSPVELNPPHLPSNASFKELTQRRTISTLPELKDDAFVDQEQSGSTVFYQHLSYSPSFSRKQMHTESIAQTSNIERARNPKVNHASKESAL